MENTKKQLAAGEFPNRLAVNEGDIDGLMDSLLIGAGLSPWLRWQIEQAQVVEIKPISEVIPTAKDRKRARASTHAQECYHNAVKVCRKLATQYCEGWVSIKSLLIRHAWNRLNGCYFDVTAEQFMDGAELYVLGFEVGADEAQDLWKQRADRPLGADLLAAAYWERNIGWTEEAKRVNQEYEAKLREEEQQPDYLEKMRRKMFGK